MLKRPQSNRNTAQVTTTADIKVNIPLCIYVSDQNPLLVPRGCKLQVEINIQL